jgi:hypothetical protein
MVRNSRDVTFGIKALIWVQGDNNKKKAKKGVTTDLTPSRRQA